MNRTVRTLLGLLTIGLVALTSCKKEPEKPQNEGTTYASVTISLQSDLRADEEDNYNAKGKWNGKDAIESVDVYIVSKGEVSFGEYKLGDFTIANQSNPTGQDKQITLTPKTAILTTPGEKEVYVLLNAPDKVRTLLKKSLPNSFKAAYNTAVEDMKATDVAKTDGTKGDIIMMTNTDVVKLNVEEGVSKDEATAASGAKNRASVQVKRAVARVLLTTTEEIYTIKYDDGTDMGTISNITYAVAQGEKAFYLSQKRDDENVIHTPAYEFMPNPVSAGSVKLNNYTEQAAAYDYSDLDNKSRSALVATDLTAALKIGEKSLESSVFIFEATHKFGETGQTLKTYTGNFRRGNTPYVLVRAKFVPAKFANDKEKTAYETAADGTFYLGENGLFYASNVVSVADDRPNQKYFKYEKGKVLYFAFVNPDKLDGTALDAPAYRNNIYHISVKAFKTIGTNWNPLYPEDPDSTDPKNPDPKPEGDPSTPPFTPGDKNTPLETYMSVDVSVIPWNVHSYEVELTV